VDEGVGNKSEREKRHAVRERGKERRNRSTERERNGRKKIYKERERNRDDHLKG
jgi:hypothetical protein